jgi:hypothetical protein
LGSITPASADADALGAFGDKSQRYGCSSAGDSGHIMMLGHPEAGIAGFFSMLRQGA